MVAGSRGARPAVPLTQPPRAPLLPCPSPTRRRPCSFPCARKMAVGKNKKLGKKGKIAGKKKP